MKNNHEFLYQPTPHLLINPLERMKMTRRMGHRIRPEGTNTCLEDGRQEGEQKKGALKPSLIYFTRKPDTAQIHMWSD